MKNILTIGLVLCLFIFNACRDDDNLAVGCEALGSTPCERQIEFTPVPDTCFDINTSFGVTTIGSDTLYKTPLHHQTSTDVFIYTRLINNVENKLWEIDLCENKASVINDDFIYHNSVLKSGPYNWLSFDDGVGGVYIAKQNGDSLKEFLPDLICRKPLFLNSQSIIFFCNFPSPISFKNVVVNINGVIVDTMDILSSSYHFLDGKIAGIGWPENSNVRHFGYLDIDTETFIPLVPLSNDEHGIVADMAWLDENNIVWIDQKGVKQVNINTLESITLKEVCENVRYRKISTVPGQKEILLSRIDFWNVGLDTLYSQTRISTFNVDTSEEQYIELK